MAEYKVTVCWYETVEVEAANECEALDKAYAELSSDIRRNGTPDDWEIDELHGGMIYA